MASLQWPPPHPLHRTSPPFTRPRPARLLIPGPAPLGPLLFLALASLWPFVLNLPEVATRWRVRDAQPEPTEGSELEDRAVNAAEVPPPRAERKVG